MENNIDKNPVIADSKRFFQVEEEGELVSDSLAMREVLYFAQEAAEEDSPCLLVGERGTGRELVAKKIHTLSSRKDFAFISIDCSKFSQDKLEEELFGREEDIIEGISGHVGLIELCSKGSLFLHNIDCIGFNVQSRLSSFLQDNLCLRVGGTTPLSPDTRILASSGVAIRQKVRDKSFQEKLFYALKRRSITLPCLQDRVQDIKSLALHFLNLAGAGKSLSPCALDALERYSWPGNVRELGHTIDMVHALCSNDIVTKNDLPLTVLSFSKEDQEQKNFSFQKISLEKLERLHICAALESFDGNRTQTARFLGITPKTLYNKLQNYGYYDEDLG